MRNLTVLIAATALAACAGTHAAGPGPAQERTMSIDGPAGKLYVSDGGEGGVPVVFVHGLGVNLESWRAQLDHLRRTRRAIAFDVRAHGKSEPARDGDYSIQAMADDVDAVVTRLGVSRFVLVGHSMAGTVLSAYAGKHPEKLAGLVYADAVGDLTRLPPADIQGFLDSTSSPSFGPEQMRASYSEMLGPDARPDTRKRVLESVVALPPRVFVQIWQAMARYKPDADLARYPGPRAAIEVADGPYMASRCVPGIQRRTLSGVSHWLMMDDPDGFNRELDAILATLR